MASVRLSTSMRESIRNRLLLHRFSHAIPPLVEKQMAFAADVFDDIFSAEDQKKLNALPKGWVPSVVGFQVKFGSEFMHLNLNGSTGIQGELCKVRAKEYEYVSVSQRVPHCSYSGCIKVYEVSHPFTAREEDLSRERAELTQQIRSAKTLISAELQQVTTVGALIAAWPEVRPFVEQYLKVEPKLPALPPQALNDILDLPVQEQEKVS